MIRIIKQGSRIMHYRDLRLFNNAGMCYPACKVDDGPLDLEHGRLETTGKKEDVTCPECLTLIFGENYQTLKEELKHA
jgi:hypothetical protein